MANTFKYVYYDLYGFEWIKRRKATVYAVLPPSIAHHYIECHILLIWKKECVLHAVISGVGAAAAVNHLICIPFVYQLLSTAYSTFIYFSFSSRSPVRFFQRTRHIFIFISVAFLFFTPLCCACSTKSNDTLVVSGARKKYETIFMCYINV